MNYSPDDFEHIVEPECDLDIWQCINCGAHAEKMKSVQHYAGCKPGEAKKWEKFYEDANNEDEAEDEEGAYG